MLPCVCPPPRARWTHPGRHTIAVSLSPSPKHAAAAAAIHTRTSPHPARGKKAHVMICVTALAKCLGQQDPTRRPGPSPCRPCHAAQQHASTPRSSQKSKQRWKGLPAGVLPPAASSAVPSSCGPRPEVPHKERGKHPNNKMWESCRGRPHRSWAAGFGSYPAAAETRDATTHYARKHHTPYNIKPIGSGTQSPAAAFGGYRVTTCAPQGEGYQGQGYT